MSKPLVPLVPPVGTSAKIAVYAGPAGSIVVNTDVSTIHVQDGSTLGGFPLSKVGHQHTQNEVVSWLGYTPAQLGFDGKLLSNQLPYASLSLTAGNSGATYDASTGVLDLSSISSGVSASSTKLANARTIAATGDATWSVSFDGSANVTAGLTLTAVGTAVNAAFVKLTTDAKGRVTATTAVAASDITSLVNGVYVSKTGDTITGSLTVTSAVSAASFSGVGTALTALNASNLGSGTVPTVRLGSGTANNTTYLRGDGTWATPSAVANTSLSGTASISPSMSGASGVFAGIGYGVNAYPAVYFVASGAGTDSHGSSIYAAGDGSIQWNLINDAGSTTNNFLKVTRSATTPLVITLTAGVINLSGLATAGLQLNGSAGTAGQVLTSQGSAAAPTWTTPSASATATILNGTGVVAPVSTTTGMYVGTSSALPVSYSINSSAPTDQKVFYTVNDSNGKLSFTFLTDNLQSGTTWLSVTRSTTTASAITLTGTAINHTGLTGGFQFNGVAGTAGQVLTSQGSSAAPTWTNAGTGTVTTVSVVAANGVTGSIATATTTPAITLTLGAITPASVAPTSATIPVNGFYLPAANTLGLSINSLRMVSVASNTLRLNNGTGPSTDRGFAIRTATAGDNADVFVRPTSATPDLYIAAGDGANSVSGAGSLFLFGGCNYQGGTASVTIGTTNLNTGNPIARLVVSNTGTVTISNLAGTGTRTVKVDANGLLSASNGGTADIPQNSQSVDYTAVLTDAGGHLFHPAADTTARTFTIPANASVAFPIGAALTFINQNAAGNLTIAITTDTMRLAGAGTTGSRTLGPNGIATAIKITATEWIISGTNLT